jgi:adenine-specific DNA-methyltransferase
MDGNSLNITQDLLEKLKELIPQAFSEEKLDMQKLQTLMGEAVNTDHERYQLSWAGKSEAYKVLQMPTTATLIPQPEQSVNWDESENIFIEGENLEVLKVLQKSYYGKIKMIYIDPPYNTGSDSFIYPDKFSETKEEYLKRIGEKDEEGYMMKEGLFRKNSKENGQFHSNWLNMMLPRLFLARNLLKDDGVIFVSIDDNEQANLKLLMDEIFGEDNFIVCISRMMKSGGAKGKFFTPNIEFILVYAKNILSTKEFKAVLNQSQIDRYYNKTETEGARSGEIFGEERLYKASLDPRPNQRYWIKCPDGSFVIPPGKNFPNNLIEGEKVTPTSEDGVWKWIYERYKNELEQGNIIFKQTSTTALVDSEGNQAKWNIYNKVWLEEQKEKGVVPSNFIDDFENRQSSKELKELSIPFDFAKPSALIKYLLQIARVENDDIVLDFFAGSGTTAHSVLQLNEESNTNCRYICVQLPEKTDENSEAYKLGYKTISEISETRIKKVIEKIGLDRKGKLAFEKPQNLGFRKYTISPSNFKIWRGDMVDNEEELKKQIELFVTPQQANAQTENILWELLIKNGVPLTEKVQKIEAGEAVIYHTSDKRLAFLLDKFTAEVQERVLALKPKTVISLDSLFQGQDMVKTNMQLKMEDEGITFKTV